MDSRHRRRPLTGRLEEEVSDVLSAATGVIEFAARHGPAGLAHAAADLIADETSGGQAWLQAVWHAEAAPFDYLGRAVLRPYVEVLAGLGIAPSRPRREGRCPFCGGGPWVAARRAGAEGDGAGRFLGCGLCGGEWPFARIRCPSCAEQDPERLPSFRGDAHPTVRIEACESCRRYVKSIDLTADARAIPEVDDLLSLGMDLWAVEQGFERIEPGLAGL
jgi:FdhE protein